MTAGGNKVNDSKVVSVVSIIYSPFTESISQATFNNKRDDPKQKGQYKMARKKKGNVAKRRIKGRNTRKEFVKGV